MILKRKALMITTIYFILLMMTGYLVSYWSNNVLSFNSFGTLTWLAIFAILTLSFSPARELILPLLNFKPFKNPFTYLYILGGLLVPYLLLKIFVYYEILLNHSLIVFYKNALLEGLDLHGLIDAAILAPIWEEVFFRGVLLFTLSKLMKPFWAVLISSVIFALFHPLYLAMAFLLGALLCVMTFKFKSLIPSMVIHSIWNFYTGKFFIYF